MSSINPKENRDVIPGWRSYMKTAQLGELYAMGAKEITLPIFPITPYIEAWAENKTTAFAGDLLSAAVLNGQTTLPEVIDAAQFVIAQSDTPRIVLEIARPIISSEVDNNASLDTTSTVIEKIEKKEEYSKKLIQIIKKENIRFPYNPIAYCELARCYISLGLSTKACEMMKIALHLAPYSRYVSRCAARLFVHLEEFDIAHRVVAHNSALRHDPWLMASEIAINSSMGRSSRFINVGKSLIASQNYSPFSCSELASAIGTLEMANGSRKKCLKFINQALIQPNDNSLAQAEWLASENNDLQFTFQDYSNLKYKAEAETRYEYFRKNYDAAFRHSVDWVHDSPYDKASVLFSSHIAYAFLKDYQSAARILNIGLVANPTETVLLNNLAYVNALNGQIEEAERAMSRIYSLASGSSSDAEICHTATNGLIQFRKGNIEEGRKLYLDAITRARESSTDKTLINKAILNYLREELVARSCSGTDVYEILAKLDTEQDKEMSRLRDDVLEEIQKQSKTDIINPFKLDL